MWLPCAPPWRSISAGSPGFVLRRCWCRTSRSSFPGVIATCTKTSRFPAPVSAVTLVLWGSTGCPAKLQAFDSDDRLVAEAAVPAVPGRKAPADPVPQFELTVRAAAIVSIRLSGPRTGEFLAADEVRFVPAGK